MACVSRPGSASAAGREFLSLPDAFVAACSGPSLGGAEREDHLRIKTPERRLSGDFTGHGDLEGRLGVADPPIDYIAELLVRLALG